MGVLAINGGQRTLSSSFPWPIWDKTEASLIQEVLDSGNWGCLSGDKVAQFEEAFAKYSDAKHCICTTSGTTALETALIAGGVCAGDEVIIPPYTFIATASAILNIGAVPVFADIDPDTYDLDPRSVEAQITSRTKAIVPVHIGGSPAEMDAFKVLANRYGLFLLEDAAQAAGAVYGGRKVGALGHAGCFSFQASKNLNCGEGGAILTNDDELAAKCRSIINCGRPDPNYSFSFQGTNFRMAEFQAAVLLGQLTRFDEQSELRDSNYRFLEEELSHINGITPAKKSSKTNRRGCHLFMFRYNAEEFGGLSRENFVAALSAEGVPCCCGYVPLYRNELFRPTPDRYPTLFEGNRRGPAYSSLQLPSAEIVSSESVWSFQQVLLASKEDMELIVKAVKKVQANQGELLDKGSLKMKSNLPQI